MRRPIQVLTVIGMIILAGLGIQVLLDLVAWQTFRNRALSDMMALAATVEAFRETHGRLPTSDEFDDLHPRPGFQVPFASDSPETRPGFSRPDQTAGEALDPGGNPFRYEKTGGSFLIRTLGPDGIGSRDDVMFGPGAEP